MKAEEFPLDQRGRNVDLSFVPTQGITTERIDETGATCVTSTLGTYAIIAEKIEPPVPYEVTLVVLHMVFHCQEEAWLYTAKMAGYGISIVLLLVYILTIQVLCHSNLCTQG